MKVEFRRIFKKDLKKVGDTELRKQVRRVIDLVEQAEAFADIQNVKKLRGDNDYYRIRIGSYRLGLKLQNDTVIFVRCLHRRDIYRYFP